MDNALLVETLRIKEIMGLITETDLLSEGPGGGVLDDILKPLTKAFKNSDLLQQMDVKYFDDVLKAAKNSTDAVARSFDNIVDGKTMREIFDSLDDAGQQFVIKQLIKQGIPEFDNAVINVVWSALGAASEQEFKTFVKTYKSVDEFIKFMTNGSNIDSEVIDVLRRYYDDVVGVAAKSGDEVVTAAEKYAGSRIAEFGAGVFRALGPLVSRNLKTVVTILSEQRKGIEVLKKEINDMFDDIITNDESLRSLRITIENKLATIERIADNGAQTVLNEIDAAYKQLLTDGKITKVQYDNFLTNKETITSTEFWNEFIAPNYKELDKQVDGLGSFFRNGKKAFSPAKLDWTSRKGKYGWVPKVTLNREGIQRAFNFLAFNSAQTGADILKRLIKSNPPGKLGANKWVYETYLRAIGPQLLIPFANAAFWTIWIPATEWFQQGADAVGLDVEWDIYNTTFTELLADLWIDDLFDILNKDPEVSTQIELGDFRPVFKSRLVEIFKSFSENDDYKDPNADGEDSTTTTTTTNFPQELIDVFPPSKLGEGEAVTGEDGVISRGELKMKDGKYYWGEEKYEIDKSQDGIWKVYNPDNGQWYDITPDW